MTESAFEIRHGEFRDVLGVSQRWLTVGPPGGPSYGVGRRRNRVGGGRCAGAGLLLMRRSRAGGTCLPFPAECCDRVAVVFDRDDCV